MWFSLWSGQEKGKPLIDFLEMQKQESQLTSLPALFVAKDLQTRCFWVDSPSFAELKNCLMDLYVSALGPFNVDLYTQATKELYSWQNTSPFTSTIIAPIYSLAVMNLSHGVLGEIRSEGEQAVMLGHEGVIMDTGSQELTENKGSEKR